MTDQPAPTTDRYVIETLRHGRWIEGMPFPTLGAAREFAAGMSRTTDIRIVRYARAEVVPPPEPPLRYVKVREIGVGWWNISVRGMQIRNMQMAESSVLDTAREWDDAIHAAVLEAHPELTGER